MLELRSKKQHQFNLEGNYYYQSKRKSYICISPSSPANQLNCINSITNAALRALLNLHFLSINFDDECRQLTHSSTQLYLISLLLFPSPMQQLLVLCKLLHTLSRWQFSWQYYSGLYSLGCHRTPQICVFIELAYRNHTARHQID